MTASIISPVVPTPAMSAHTASDRGEVILIIDDDAPVAEALVFMLEAPGRTIIVCHDVESAEQCLQRFPVTHVITDVQFSSSFRCEGIRMIEVIRRIRPESRVVVATGYGSELIERAAAAHRVEAFLTKPFDHAQLLTALDLPDVISTAPSRVVRIPTIEEMIDMSSSSSVFQPIMRIDDGNTTVHGFEALAQPHPHWPLGSTVSLFEYAASRGRLIDLNVACMRGAFRLGAPLARAGRLFVNVDPPVLSSRNFASVFRKTAAMTGAPLERLVIELTENGACPDEEAAVKAVMELRAEGVEFAFDDIGSAHSHLSLIERIRPNYLKISHTFGVHFERSSANRRIIGNILALGNEFGSEVILEGVETAESLAAAREIGIRYAQGYFFGRPGKADDAKKLVNLGDAPRNWD